MKKPWRSFTTKAMEGLTLFCLAEKSRISLENTNHCRTYNMPYAFGNDKFVVVEGHVVWTFASLSASARLYRRFHDAALFTFTESMRKTPFLMTTTLTPEACRIESLDTGDWSLSSRL